MERTIVTVTAHDGSIKTFSGDTAIVFTVEKCNDFINGKVKQVEANTAFVGYDIPDIIFAETMGSLFSSFIATRQKEHPMIASFDLHEVSKIMEAYSKKISDETTYEEKVYELNYIIEKLSKNHA